MLISALAAVFQADKDCFEEVRKQTPTPTLDTSQAIFPRLSRRSMSYQTVYLHRVIAEQTIDHKLRPGEVVHHLDHDKTNSSPDNLVVCSSASVHRQYHTRSLPQKFE